MALIDRIKERAPSDLSDAELQAVIDEIAAEITRRFGAIAPITVYRGDDRELADNARFITLLRPLDAAQAVAVTEIDGSLETVLGASDYRVLHGGRTLERLSTGANARLLWAPLVKIVYTPASDQAQRDEATIEIAQLEIEARGLSAERAGDWNASYPDLAEARQKILSRLSPRRGLALA